MYKRQKHSIQSYKEEGTAFCVFLIDIDDFKEFNRKYGIETGDIVLQDSPVSYTHLPSTIRIFSSGIKMPSRLALSLEQCMYSIE